MLTECCRARSRHEHGCVPHTHTRMHHEFFAAIQWKSSVSVYVFCTLSLAVPISLYTFICVHLIWFPNNIFFFLIFLKIWVVEATTKDPICTATQWRPGWTGENHFHLMQLFRVHADIVLINFFFVFIALCDFWTLLKCQSEISRSEGFS